jgi:hypothetical protein
LCSIGFTECFVRQYRIRRAFVAGASILEPIGKAQDGLFEGGIRRLEFLLEGNSVDRFSAISNAKARFFELVL